jgi:hypothetical protein
MSEVAENEVFALGLAFTRFALNPRASRKAVGQRLRRHIDDPVTMYRFQFDHFAPMCALPTLIKFHFQIANPAMCWTISRPLERR